MTRLCRFEKDERVAGPRQIASGDAIPHLHVVSGALQPQAESQGARGPRAVEGERPPLLGSACAERPQHADDKESGHKPRQREGVSGRSHSTFAPLLPVIPLASAS